MPTSEELLKQAKEQERIEAFDNIKSNMMLKVSDIGRDIRQELPKWDLWINNGEHSADKSKIDRLEQMEFTMFELPKEYTHIGMFKIETCSKVAQVSYEFLNKMKHE